MVTPVAIVELLLIVGIAVLIIYLVLNLIGSQDKKIISIPFVLLIVSVVILIVLLVLDGTEPIIELFSVPVGIMLLLILIIAILLIVICLILNTIESRDKKVDYVVFSLITLFAILVVILLMIDGVWFIWFSDISLHIGLILGLPALICITAAMILVLYNEPKFVFWHGLLGITAWILTLLNVISLFWMSQQNVLNYSGLTHFMHIIGGGGGLAAGFANALLGTSGQRKPAKLTGFITLGCWWGAFLLGLLL
ncbi:MAG: hypothetical protein ACW96X_04055 [Promethearchaeota archaeon]|jgi:hypothetical protein